LNGTEEHDARCTLQVTHHTSHITRHTSHVTHHTPHITHHTSHVTHHTSHISHLTSHITRYTCPHILAQQALEVFCRLQLLHRLVPMLHCSGRGGRRVVAALYFRGGKGRRGRAGGGGRLFSIVAAAHGGVGGMYRLHRECRRVKPFLRRRRWGRGGRGQSSGFGARTSRNLQRSMANQKKRTREATKHPLRILTYGNPVLCSVSIYRV
jgi:hypothetical protein